MTSFALLCRIAPMASGTRSRAASAEALPPAASAEISSVTPPATVSYSAPFPVIPKTAIFDATVRTDKARAKEFVEQVKMHRTHYKTPGVHDAVIDFTVFFPAETEAVKLLASVAGIRTNNGAALFNRIIELHGLEKLDHVSPKEREAKIAEIAKEFSYDSTQQSVQLEGG